MGLSVDIRRTLKGFRLDVSFEAGRGVLGILGASGAGKSMTLKAVAGLVTPDAGRIALNGRALFDAGARVDLRPQARNVGYLFQNYALFPHMTVLENVLCARGASAREARALLERMQLLPLAGRYPAQLSGGQQQRAALARCLAARPEALLLDEPFSALDEHMRERTQWAFIEALRDYAGAVILVTHSRDEAYRLCGELLVLDDGRVAAHGETRALFENPGRLAAARLTGCKNFSRARPAGPGRVYCEDWNVTLTVARGWPPGCTHVGVRAHDFKPADGADGVNRLPMRVVRRVEGPFAWDALVDVGGARRVWWKSDKPERGALPSHLQVAPERVMPLAGGPGEEADG